MELTKKFGRNVRTSRQKRGYTIEVLADKIGLAYSYVGEIERGRRNPTLAVVERIAEALEVDPLDLFADDKSASIPG